MRWALLAGLVFFSACVPTAVLQPPEPVRGERFTLGGSLFPAPVSSPYPVWGLPYLGYAVGDGQKEFSLSFQLPLRLGAKVRLAEGLSLDGGVSLWVDLGQGGVSGASADAGLLLRVGEGFYLSPRLQVTPWASLAPQLTLGYWGEGVAVEGGYGPMGPYLALGFSFQNAP
ncbi:hypothetical protein [Thermus tenuipuniceus]|uniref:hypothetical protein n=1 Tax=Thermus tenuipuniceus TaxID=2078690 RepID=UPI000CF9BF70|nr:hypothetical protein [Thermus tenuipuniceus]